MSGNLQVFVVLQLLAVLLVTQVQGDLQFSLKIVRFSNPQGLHQDRKRCDLLAGQCDTFLEITVSTDGKTKSKRTTRTVQNKNNLQGSDISPNPISFTMSSWPLDKPVSVQVTAWDEDVSGNQIITSFPITVSLTPLAFSRKLTYSAEIAVTDTAGRTLAYQVAAKCNENFYGLACNEYCVANCDLTTATSTSSSTSPNTTPMQNSTDTTQSIDLVQPDATSNISDTTAVTDLMQNQNQSSDLPPIYESATSTSYSDSNTSNLWQPNRRLSDDAAADAIVNPDDATSNSNVFVIVAVCAVAALVCTVLALAFVFVRRLQNRKHRESRVPVFDIDDDANTYADMDNRNTVTSYCGSDSGTTEPKVQIHGNNSQRYVRMTASPTTQHADDAFQNCTYGQLSSYNTNQNSRDSDERDTCSVYSRPPAPRPVNDGALFNNNRIVSQNVYSTPAESAATDEYYNHH